MDVHNHGSEDGPGLGCPETRQPDGTLLGLCQTPLGRSHEKINARIDRLADRIAHARRQEDRFHTEVRALQDEVKQLREVAR